MKNVVRWRYRTWGDKFNCAQYGEVCGQWQYEPTGQSILFELDKFVVNIFHINCGCTKHRNRK